MIGYDQTSSNIKIRHIESHKLISLFTFGSNLGLSRVTLNFERHFHSFLSKTGPESLIRSCDHVSVDRYSQLGSIVAARSVFTSRTEASQSRTLTEERRGPAAPPTSRDSSEAPQRGDRAAFRSGRRNVTCLRSSCSRTIKLWF